LEEEISVQSNIKIGNMQIMNRCLKYLIFCFYYWIIHVLYAIY